MTSLVTGASGFIGQALANYLGAAGETPILIVRSSLRESAGEPRLAADITEVTPAHFLGADTVFHLAGAAHRYGLSEDEVSRINLHGTSRVIAAAREAGVQRIVYVSSVKVNCETAPLPVGADSPCEPEDAYGKSKLDAETEVLRSGLDPVVLRLPLVYGAGVKGNFAALVRLVESGLPLPFGSVPSQRTYLGIDNLLDFLGKCRSEGSIPGGIYYLGDASPLSLPDLLRQIGIASRHPVRLFDCPSAMLGLLARVAVGGERSKKLLGNLVLDIDMTKAMTGWSPPYTTQQCLARMFGHLD